MSDEINKIVNVLNSVVYWHQIGVAGRYHDLAKNRLPQYSKLIDKAFYAACKRAWVNSGGVFVNHENI